MLPNRNNTLLHNRNNYIPGTMHFRYWVNSQWVYIQSLQANKGLKDPWDTLLTWETFPIKIHLAQSYEIIISFMRIKWFFIWTNYYPLHSRMLCAKFGWKWPSGTGEEAFWISSIFFRYFLIISPWKYGEALNLNKLESSSPKDALCQVWLKLAQWFWRRRFIKFHHFIFFIL